MIIETIIIGTGMAIIHYNLSQYNKFKKTEFSIWWLLGSLGLMKKKGDVNKNIKTEEKREVIKWVQLKTLFFQQWLG